MKFEELVEMMVDGDTSCVPRLRTSFAYRNEVRNVNNPDRSEERKHPQRHGVDARSDTHHSEARSVSPERDDTGGAEAGAVPARWRVCGEEFL